MDSDKKLTLIKNGRMASLANEHLSDIVNKHRVSLLSKLKNMCRSGKHDVVEYASTVSALNVLDDVQMDIKKQIDAAQHIEKEVLNHE